METYRLNSKFVENEREFLIQTANDVSRKTVSTEIYINGKMADEVRFPHPENSRPEEILSLVKATHGGTKQEVEGLLKAYRAVEGGGNTETMFQVANAFFYKRFFQDARRLLVGIIEIEEDNHQACNLLSQTELALGNTECAIETARMAVGMKPDYADYHNNLGVALMAVKDYEAAVAEFEQAVGINMYYSDAYFNCGLALLSNAIDQQNTSLFANVMSRSIDYFNKASLIFPQFKTSDFDKGLAHLKAHELEQAYHLLLNARDAKIEQHRRKHASYVMKAALSPHWLSEQAVDERIEFLNREIEQNPTYFDLQAELSQCYLERASINWKKGIDQYVKTLDQNPSLSKVADNLEQAEQAHQKIQEVIEMIARKG